jgi:putative transposase
MKDETKQENADDFDWKGFEKRAIQMMYEKKPLTGRDGILTPLIKRLLEQSLQAELDTHVGETRADGNRKNGYTPKTIKTEMSSFEIENPRDRDGSFEPVIVKKRQTSLPEDIERGILSLFAHGSSYQDIIDFYSEKYGVELSKAAISAVTDKVLPLFTEWRSRPLEALYTVVWLDAMFVKAKEEGAIELKSMYCVLGLTPEGYKDVLAIHVSEAEGAKFWLQVLTDLTERGVKDILIACVDGLTGFPEAIETIFPKTEVQLCIIHQIRNSLRYVTWKDARLFMADLKKVYQASTKEIAEANLDTLEETWGAKYPAVIKSWRTKWHELSNYFKYPEGIRRIIYTTNTVEGFHRQLRKITKTKGAFPSTDALLKLTFLAIQRIVKKWTHPILGWRVIHAQLVMIFGERMGVSRE